MSIRRRVLFAVTAGVASLAGAISCGDEPPGDIGYSSDASTRPDVARDGGRDAPGSVDARGDAWPGDASPDRSVDAAPDATPDVAVDSPPSNDCPRVRVSVAAGNSLNVREMPSSGATQVGSLPNGAIVTVLDRVTGETVSGNSEWFRIESGAVTGYVSGAFATCTTDDLPVLMPPGAYYLPLECGTSSVITQGNFGTTSHSGRSKYAFDFGIPLNTPMVAMADGIVDETFDETGPGDNCYNGGPSSCFPYANYVALRHGDGSGSIYKHLNRVDVTVGQFVPRGAVIGLSGSTGYSTGPHAHVMRQELCGTPLSCESMALSFADVPNGVLGKVQGV